MKATWALISGEYPPQSGGVSDYTALLAGALAEAGDTVHVWAPATAGASPRVTAVTVHPLPGRFGRHARRQMTSELAALAAAGAAPRLLIQYVPHAYGRKAMNLGFCHWVWQHRQLEPWVMFHEVAFPTPVRWHLRHRVLAWTTQRMAVWMYRAAARSFVATPAWSEWLDRLAPGGRAPQWLPVPSNLPEPRAEAVTAARREWGTALADGSGTDSGIASAMEIGVVSVIGSFCGGVADYTRAGLERLVPALLAADPGRIAVLAGGDGLRVRAAILAAAPALRARVFAPGYLTPAATAALLAACDLIVQPYPDGVSGRRGTAMAALALGVPLLTNSGRFTEPRWRDAAAVALVPIGDATALLTTAAALLADPTRRRQLGAAGRQLYQDYFAISHTVRALRTAAASLAAHP